jgi:predicted nucleic acid-binding protein
VTPVTVEADSCRDPDDLLILGTALAAGADGIVSGDKDLLVLGSFRGIAILKPRALWHRISSR